MQTDSHKNGTKARAKRVARAPVRERILAAAGDLFHKQGIRGVGVEAIAEAAKTNKMTLYRYFGSKEELIAEWVRGMVAHKEEEWQDLTAQHVGEPGGLRQGWRRGTAGQLREMGDR